MKIYKNKRVGTFSYGKVRFNDFQGKVVNEDGLYIYGFEKHYVKRGRNHSETTAAYIENNRNSLNNYWICGFAVKYSRLIKYYH